MNLGELVKRTRRELSDDSGTSDVSLIKDWQLIDYANDAETEACRRAKLLADSVTSDICHIPILSDISIYDLDPRIIYVRRAKLASRTKPLGKITYHELDEIRPGWDTEAGVIEGLVTGMDTGKIRTYRIPAEADTLTLTVIRRPLVPMVKPKDTPEIKHKAYDNQDSEMYDPKLSERNLQFFEREFGPCPGAINEVFDDMNLPFDGYDGSY